MVCQYSNNLGANRCGSALTMMQVFGLAGGQICLDRILLGIMVLIRQVRRSTAGVADVASLRMHP